jgi:flagellin-like hook-associated protein FlgL
MTTTVTLSAGVRSNLLSLQESAGLFQTTQTRLATGKKVNSALDNPTNYFTSQNLQSRAGELSNLLDAMTNGINTVKAASNGLESITTTIQSMQATATQARQDASWQSTSYTYSVAVTNTGTLANLSFTGGSVGTTAVTVSLDTVPGATTGVVDTIDQAVTAINNTVALQGHIKASNDAGQLRIQNLSTIAVTIAGAGGGAVDGVATTDSIAGNTTRSNLVTQFNLLRDQLDKTAGDASFNGVNLLQGDALKLFFNELSTSSLTVQSTDANGINNTVLGVGAATAAEFENNTSLDTRLLSLHNALTQVNSQASDFGANLSIVQNRQTFSTRMINTLQTGADGLTLADTNLEGANMLALQTRQQLSITALSLASQANGAVLRLFG